ncbi:MAG: stage III sporulation protein AF [Lachnospiraceae bacterium]|nr:stage III sporulation protein AF [Lachnospiraceae bacterium]
MNEIVEWIKRMTIFLIMAKMILHLRPKQEYEKYLKLVVGLMVLTMILEQGISIINGGIGFHLEERVRLWEKMLSENS